MVFGEKKGRRRTTRRTARLLYGLDYVVNLCVVLRVALWWTSMAEIRTKNTLLKVSDKREEEAKLKP